MKIVVSLTPESKSDVSHAGIFVARCSFFFVHGAISYNVSSEVEIARFFLVFTTSAVYSRTNLI